MTIARVALPLAAATTFDYWIPDGLPVAAGTLVRVRLARRALVGVVLEVADDSAVDPDEAAAARGAGRGRAAAARRRARARRVRRRLLPRAARPRARADAAAARRARSVDAPPAPRGRRGAGSTSRRRRCRSNDAQQAACAAITRALGGSRRSRCPASPAAARPTSISRRRARRSRAAGRCCCWCPRSTSRRSSSSASPPRCRGGARCRCTAGSPRASGGATGSAAAAGDADLVLGTRLAVFAPLPRLALVVVDEEHDPSYKQQDGVRYHARDVAVWRARQRGVPVVLGSATPSLETLEHAHAAALPRGSTCRARAVTGAGLPRIALRAGARARRGTRGWRRRWSRRSRRGSRAASSRWSSSTAAASRRRCCARRAAGRPAARAAARASSSIATRACCAAITAATRGALPRACPDCGNVDLLPLGHGTQRLEGALAARFPDARIARIDRDSTTRRQRSPRRWRASTRANSTSSSARRCWPRGTTSRG